MIQIFFFMQAFYGNADHLGKSLLLRANSTPPSGLVSDPEFVEGQRASPGDGRVPRNARVREFVHDAGEAIRLRLP